MGWPTWFKGHSGYSVEHRPLRGSDSSREATWETTEVQWEAVVTQTRVEAVEKVRIYHILDII